MAEICTINTKYVPLHFSILSVLTIKLTFPNHSKSHIDIFVNQIKLILCFVQLSFCINVCTSCSLPTTPNFDYYAEMLWRPLLKVPPHLDISMHKIERETDFMC